MNLFFSRVTKFYFLNEGRAPDMQEHTSIIQTRTNTTKSNGTNTNTNWMQKKKSH